MPKKEPAPRPGKGSLGWLGRQVGYIVGAVRRRPAEKTVYRHQRVEETPHPHDSRVKLRRTTIDEVVEGPDGGGPSD